MDARIWFGQAVGVALATLVTLFVLHYWVDTSLRQDWRGEVVEFEERAALEAEQERRLTSGPMPIERAMQTLARGRRADPLIAPAPSEDMSAASGWMHHPGYAPPPPPPEPEPEVMDEALEPGTDESATGGEQPAEDAAPAGAEPAAAAPAADETAAEAAE